MFDSLRLFFSLPDFVKRLAVQAHLSTGLSGEAPLSLTTSSHTFDGPVPAACRDRARTGSRALCRPGYVPPSLAADSAAESPGSGR